MRAVKGFLWICCAILYGCGSADDNGLPEIDQVEISQESDLSGAGVSCGSWSRIAELKITGCDGPGCGCAGYLVCGNGTEGFVATGAHCIQSTDTSWPYVTSVEVGSASAQAGWHSSNGDFAMMYITDSSGQIPSASAPYYVWDGQPIPSGATVNVTTSRVCGGYTCGTSGGAFLPRPHTLSAAGTMGSCPSCSPGTSASWSYNTANGCPGTSGSPLFGTGMYYGYGFMGTIYNSTKVALADQSMIDELCGLL